MKTIPILNPGLPSTEWWYLVTDTFCVWKGEQTPEDSQAHFIYKKVEVG